MRILIVADIEGVSGVVHPEQTRPGSVEYERARLWMTREVNALVQGALDGGATDVWAVDSHGSYRNLLLDELHPEARLLSGKPRIGGMLAGIVEGGPWDGVFLAGAHARAGSFGVLAHTINGQAFTSVNVDGKAVGECFLNAALAGEHGVPVRLASGDDCLAKEIAPFLAGAEIVTVKQALANRCAVHLPFEAVHAALGEAAAHAVQRDMPPFAPTLPAWVEVQTVQPVFADVFSLVPGVERLYPTTVAFEAESMTMLVRMLNTFSALWASV